MEDKISVIIPVYNAIEYIERCIESVLAQSYNNIEIILVNDGSTDGSKEICDNYAKQDHRVRVVHQENHGVSYTRNVGLKIASGKYIGFVDSDDYIEKNMYEILMDNIKKKASDISICGYFITKDGTDINRYIANNAVLDSQDSLRLLIEDKTIRNFLWSMLYKKELFNDISFPENVTYEDVMVIYKLFLKANRISIVDKPLYHYVKRENSITSSNNIKSGLILLKALEKQRNDIIEIFPDLYKNCILHEYEHICFWSYEIRNSRNLDYIKVSKKLKKDTLKKILEYNDIPKRVKNIMLIKYKFDNFNYIFYRIKQSIKQSPILAKWIVKVIKI